MKSLQGELLELLEKPEWTPEDKLRLLSLLERTDPRELETLLKERNVHNPQPLKRLDSVLSKRMLQNIHERAGIETAEKRPVVRLWITRMAAASVIFMVVALGYFYWSGAPADKRIISNVNQPPMANDVAPGGDKAILTLGDGTKMVLDAGSNGAISKQGGVTVVNVNGLLAYNQGEDGVKEVLYNTITTPKGGQYQVVLADGSKAWLNAASSLRFPTRFSGKERRVELTGEGYFEVAHNKAMPFLVTARGVAVQVLGTHFNLNSYEDEGAIKATLLEGSVKVINENASALLKPGQQAHIDVQKGVESGSPKIGITKPDLENVMAWKNGRFFYQDTDLETIMRQIARWYDVEVIYQNKINDHYTVNVPRNVPVSQLFKFIEMSGGVHFTIEGKKIMVSKQKN